MRILLAILLAIPLVSATLYVDLLQPLDPEARRGDAARDFEASKRILASDFDRLQKSLETGDVELILYNVGQVERSLELVNDIGGYSVGYYSNKHSQKLFFDIVAYVASVRVQYTIEEEIEEPVKIRIVVYTDYRGFTEAILYRLLSY